MIATLQTKGLNISDSVYALSALQALQQNQQQHTNTSNRVQQVHI